VSRATRFTVACFTSLALASAARTACAATDAEETERLIGEGVALRQQAKDAEALADFTRAFELTHDPRARAQMGLAEEALGQWVLAETHLEEALAADSAWITRHRGDLTGALEDIRGHLGSLEVLEGTAGAEVLVNGRIVGHMPLAKPLRVPAGTVALEVRAPGFVPVARSVNVPANGVARETVGLARDEAWRAPAAPRSDEAVAPIAATGPAPAAMSSTDWRRAAAWAAAGGAAASLTVGIVFTTRVYSYADKFNHSCGVNDPNLGGGSCRSYHDTSTGAEAPAIIGYSLAAALAGVSVYLFEKKHPPTKDGATAAWSCGPGVATGVACTTVF
jgi:PEGA domain-containing protein